MFKIFTVVGTRPEIIKLSRIINLFDKNFEHKIIHTGQNFDYELNEIFFNEMKIRKPDFFLNSAKPTAIQTISEVINKFESLIIKEKPDLVFILGDTNSSYSALAAKKNKIPIIHFEAGNRCFDENVPEEINRKIVDHISDLNLTYTNISKKNLINENIDEKKIICIGSPMKEVINFYNKKINSSKILNKLKLKKKNFFLVSLHREENVDDPIKLKKYFKSIIFLTKKYKLKALVSTHYRTAKKLKKINLKNKNLLFEKPFGFFDYMYLQKYSFATLSDSGTLSEESSILGRTAIHLRHCTERPEGLENKAIILCQFSEKNLIKSVNFINKKIKVKNHIAYDKNNVSSIILKKVISFLHEKNNLF